MSSSGARFGDVPIRGVAVLADYTRGVEMTDITKETEYAWYKNALAGQKPPIHDGVVQSGRFRMRVKDGPAVGVAIWRDWTQGGILMASYDLRTYVCDEKAEPRKLENGTTVPTNYHKLCEKWTFLAARPVPPAIYKAYYESGCTKWPDESQAGADMRAAAQAEKQERPAPVTFQHPPDTFEGLQERYNTYKPQAEALIAKGAATDGITSDIAADLKNVFGGIETTCDTKRLEATMELRNQVAAINGKWNVLVQGAKELKSHLAVKVISPYHAKEVLRLQAEQAAKIELARQNNAPITDAMTQAPKVASGTVGRKVTPRSVTEAKIVDRAALLEAVKDHIWITEALQRIADAGLVGRVSRPGVVYETTNVSA